MAYAYTPEEVSHRNPVSGGPDTTTFLGYVAGIASRELLDISGTNEFVRDRPVRRHGDSGRRRIKYEMRRGDPGRADRNPVDDEDRLSPHVWVRVGNEDVGGDGRGVFVLDGDVDLERPGRPGGERGYRRPRRRRSRDRYPLAEAVDGDNTHAQRKCTKIYAH